MCLRDGGGYRQKMEVEGRGREISESVIKAEIGGKR